jgi:hypothetical protein
VSAAITYRCSSVLKFAWVWFYVLPCRTVTIPDGVSIEVKGRSVRVKGPRGMLQVSSCSHLSPPPHPSSPLSLPSSPFPPCGRQQSGAAEATSMQQQQQHVRQHAARAHSHPSLGPAAGPPQLQPQEAPCSSGGI